MKKSKRIMIASEIIARIKREMKELRLMEPIRRDIRAPAASHSNESTIHIESA